MAKSQNKDFRAQFLFCTKIKTTYQTTEWLNGKNPVFESRLMKHKCSNQPKKSSEKNKEVLQYERALLRSYSKIFLFELGLSKSTMYIAYLFI